MLPLSKRARPAGSAVGFGLAILLAGCVHSRPTGHPRAPEAPQPPSLPQPPAPATPPPPAQVSRPRPPADAADNMAAHVLAWDAVSKEQSAKPGQTNADFSFSLTNVSPETVVIYDTSTTCDCTVAKMPSKPWLIPSGGTGKIEASVNLQGKSGATTNYVIVFTSKGNRLLSLQVDLPKR